MADVLSQSQIDALLKSMQGGGGGGEEPQEAKQEEKAASVKQEKETIKYSKYDFYSPRKFTKDKLKILTSVFENYARIITSRVNGVFRVMTDITVMEVQERRYYVNWALRREPSIWAAMCCAWVLNQTAKVTGSESRCRLNSRAWRRRLWKSRIRLWFPPALTNAILPKEIPFTTTF